MTSSQALLRALYVSGVRLYLSPEKEVMDHLPEAVHDTGTVKVNSHKSLMLDGVEGRSLFKLAESLLIGVPPDGLEHRMAGRDPLQVMLLRRLPVGRAARIAARQDW